MGTITGFPITTAVSGLTGAEGVAALQKANDMPAAADVTNVTTEGVKLFMNGALAVPSAAGLLMQRLNVNASSVNVLVISDSIGYGTDRWVYMLAEWYGENYPTHTIAYYQWDDAGGDYDTVSVPVEIVSIGTGTNVLAIYNFANSGKNIDYGLGSKFAKSVAELDNCDLVIVNHGRNQYDAGDDDYTDKIRVPRFLSGIGQNIQAHPDAGLIIIAQSEGRDDNDYQRTAEAIYKTCALLNADNANGYAVSIALNKDPDLFQEDGIHPSNLGSQVIYLEPVIALHNANSIPKPAISPYDLQLKNILLNGDFSAFAEATPDNWTSSGTITKETGIFFGPNGYSVGIEGSGSYIRNAIPTLTQPSIRGKWVTLSVLMYIESGAGANAGRISIATPLDTSTSSTALAAGVSQGGWKWVSVSAKIRDTSGYIWIKILGDTGGAVFIDRAILVQGKLPTNAAS